MVFYNSKYGSMSNAKPKEDGLVVIGVMIQVCGQETPLKSLYLEGVCIH